MEKNAGCVLSKVLFTYFNQMLALHLFMWFLNFLSLFSTILPSLSSILQTITGRQTNHFSGKRQYPREISIPDEHLLNPLEEPSLPGR